jgi:hypothetical protein
LRFIGWEGFLYGAVKNSQNSEKSPMTSQKLVVFSIVKLSHQGPTEKNSPGDPEDRPVANHSMAIVMRNMRNVQHLGAAEWSHNSKNAGDRA